MKRVQPRVGSLTTSSDSFKNASHGEFGTMKTIFLFLVTLSGFLAPAFATDISKFKIKGNGEGAAAADGSKPLVPPDFSQISAASNESDKNRIKLSCTTGTGQKIKQGEAGFDSCLTEAQAGAGQQMKNGEEARRSLELKFGN